MKLAENRSVRAHAHGRRHLKGYKPPSQWLAELATVGLGMLMPMVVGGEVLRPAGV
jgi:hypothetical protein